MKPKVKNFSSYSPSDLYALYEDVYFSSEGMIETLDDKYPDLESFEDDISTLQCIPGAIALAAEIDQEPVAYLTIRPRSQSRLRHTSDLNMGVAQASRGLGLGKLILRTGLEHASASPELEIVYLMVWSDNLPAVRLYERMGFETLTVLSRDAKIDDSYRDGLLMRKFVDKRNAQQMNAADR